MAKDIHEWIKQADYDFDTALLMHRSGRNFYAVFMCHMSIEKALKAVLFKNTGEIPPKTHNLLGLLLKNQLKPPHATGLFISKLNEANVATRYPEQLSEMIKVYTDIITEEIILGTKDTLIWIKSMLSSH